MENTRRLIAVIKSYKPTTTMASDGSSRKRE